MRVGGKGNREGKGAEKENGKGEGKVKVNKKWFSTLTISRWPQTGGMYWYVAVQLQMGCSLLIVCVLICCVVFY